MAVSLPEGVRAIEGGLDAAGKRFAVIASRWNALVTDRLLEGAVEALVHCNARPGDVLVVRVSGAWELPQTAARVLASERVDAVIALGCLVKGDTIHFDLIAGETAKGLANLGLRGEVPVVFGVLTTDTLEQALQRAGGKLGNTGTEAAHAAIQQANLYRALAARAGTPT